MHKRLALRARLMNKFTIFTVILAVSVITVTLDLAVRDYFDVKEGETSVISAPVSAGADEPQEVAASAQERASASDFSAAQPLVPPESPVFIEEPAISAPSVTITQEAIKNAGFENGFTEKHFDGKVFQLLDITKNPVDSIGLYEVTKDGVAIASVTEISLRDEIRALQLYILLQNKTKPYIDLSLNETNAYGDRSFYINHQKKPDEAFLVVKIGKTLYGFAYVKTYHPQIKRLIQLLAQAPQ